MASLRGTSNLINILPKRYASAAAATAATTQSKRVALPKESVRVTKLDNGITVASLENHSPVTRVAAVLNVGARDEAHSEQGAAHALRVVSSLATRNYSLFGVSRNLNQIGAELSVTSTREQTTYLLEAARPAIDKGVDILSEIVSRPELRSWEVHDAHTRLNFDLDVYDESPELKIADLIHKAAFRNGVSRSLYAPRFNVHGLDAEAIRQFRDKHFTANRLTIVGVGIKHEDLIRHSDLFRLSAPDAAAKYTREQSKYLGSELRVENLNGMVHVALASEGVSASSKEALASAIASHAFGTGEPRVKYSSGIGKIQKAALPYASEPAAVSAFNANYSDSGLFGFHVVAAKNDIGKVVKGVYQECLKTAKNGLSQEEVDRAKNSVKVSLAYSLESNGNLVEAIAKAPQAASTNTNIEELFKAVDAVSVDEVNAFLKRLGTGKASLAAIGDLSELPRIDELSAQTTSQTPKFNARIGNKIVKRKLNQNSVQQRIKNN